MNEHCWSTQLWGSWYFPVSYFLYLPICYLCVEPAACHKSVWACRSEPKCFGALSLWALCFSVPEEKKNPVYVLKQIFLFVCLSAQSYTGKMSLYYYYKQHIWFSIIQRTLRGNTCGSEVNLLCSPKAQLDQWIHKCIIYEQHSYPALYTWGINMHVVKSVTSTQSIHYYLTFNIRYVFIYL